MTLVPFRSVLVFAGPRGRFQGQLRGPAISAPAVLSFGGLALLGACATYTARPLVQDDELAQLRAVRAHDVRITYAQRGAPRASAAQCFDPSDGLDECELVALALTIHPRLRARRLEIGEAQALQISAGLLPNPELGLFVRPGIDGTSGTSFGLEALFALLRPDERAAKRAVADAQIEVVRAEIADLELQVATEVRRAHIAVRSAEQATRLFQQELVLRDNAVELVRQQRELGEATEIAPALVELDRTTVQRQLRDAQALSEHERRVLNALVGVPPTLDLDLAGSGDEIEFTIFDDPTDDEIDARLLSGRPDLRARVAAYRVAEGELRLAIARRYPEISLGPSFEKDVDGSQSLGLGASIELPLFDRNQGEIAAKAAARDRVRAEYAATLFDLRARAFEARAQMRRARSEVELQQSEIMPLVQRTEDVFEGALRARELSIFEWLSARTRAIQARRDLLDALTRYASAVVDLDAATGSPLVDVSTESLGEESGP